jgi:DNA-binding transcriptional regulator GbsR (MarR family)
VTTETRSTPSSPPSALLESERLAGDAIGRLMQFWGFKRNMGRVWTVLYLSPHPLSAAALRDRLAISAGSVSMTVNELERWGVVRRRLRPGERREYFEAETDLWKMISRVFRERELVEVRAAIEALRDALDLAEGEAPERRALLRTRLRALLDLAELGRTLLETVLSDKRVDASRLARVLLGRSSAR